MSTPSSITPIRTGQQIQGSSAAAQACGCPGLFVTGTIPGERGVDAHNTSDDLAAEQQECGY